MISRFIPHVRAGAPPHWLHWRSWRFLQVLLLLLAVLLLNPLQSGHPLLTLTMHIMVLNGLFVSLSAAGFAPRMKGILYGAWLINILLEASAVWIGDPALATKLYLASRVAAMFLLAGCMAATLRYVLLSRQVTTDSICAAIVAYLFICMSFAAAYQYLATFDPHSFSIPSDMPVASRGELELSMLYYSYVTLATLGYGDIAPRLPIAQMIAVLEAIVGQFYIAVVIAWLVSVHAAARSR
jgi:hypothetical protein